MTYSEQRWYDGEGSGTPLTADRLNHMESGIGDSSRRLDNVESAIPGKADAAAVLPQGGTAGQLLYKTSSTNYAVQWQTPGVTAHTHPQSAIDNLSTDLATIRSNASADVSDLAALKTAMFGSSTRTRPPAAYVYYNASSGNLAASTDFAMTSGWAKVTDPDNMATLGDGTIANPVEIVVPVTGMYLSELHLYSTATTGQLFGRLVINQNKSATLATRATTQALVSTTGFATAEGTHLHMAKQVPLTAGDRIGCLIFSTVQFALPATHFGAPRVQMFGLRYVGPYVAP